MTVAKETTDLGVPEDVIPRRNHLTSFRSSYERVPSLDGLRAISILAVLFTHYFWESGPGGYGVLLFFIISGFLITRLLFAEQKLAPVSLGGFYLRRLFRLYPVLVVFAGVAAIVGLALYRDAHLDEILGVLFYYSNYLVVWKEMHHLTWGFEPLQVFWSLSVEEHFYFLFPPVFLALKRPGPIIGFAVAVILFCTGYRYIEALRYPELVPTWYFGMLTQFRIDSICYGVLLAAICEHPRCDRFTRSLISPTGVALSIIVIVAGFVLLRDPALKTGLRWPLLGLPLAALTAAAVFSPRYALVRRVLNHPLAVWIGQLSYSLYVWHLLVLVVANALFPSGLTALITLPLSFLVAWASFTFVEQPIIGLRRRLRPANQRARSRTESEPVTTYPKGSAAAHVDVASEPRL